MMKNLFAFFIQRVIDCKDIRIVVSNSKNISSLRDEIFHYICSNPGCTESDLISALSVSRGSISYHLHKLQKSGQIRRIPLKKSTLYYSSNCETTEKTVLQQDMIYLMSQKKSRNFIKCLAENPVSNRYELAEILSLSPETIRYYLKKCTEKNILWIEKIEDNICYSLTKEADAEYRFLSKTSDEEI